jgi:hypothetical protein
LTRVELLWQNGGKEKKEAKEFNLFSWKEFLPHARAGFDMTTYM